MSAPRSHHDNMKHLILGLLLGAILGLMAGFAVGTFVFPYLFPPAPVNEAPPHHSAQDIVAGGAFSHAEPSDPIHYGSGHLILFDDLLHLQTDFEVGPGPKYHVYLVPEEAVMPNTRVEETMFVDLGRLKAFSGSQYYPVPPGVDLTDYRSVVIWCEQFNVLISPADLVFKR